MSKPAVEAHGLREAFSQVRTLDGLSLAVLPRPQSGCPVTCAFVPAIAMPGWLQAFGTHQPVDALVNTERALILGARQHLTSSSAGVERRLADRVRPPRRLHLRPHAPLTERSQQWPSN